MNEAISKNMKTFQVMTILATGKQDNWHEDVRERVIEDRCTSRFYEYQERRVSKWTVEALHAVKKFTREKMHASDLT